ncbi:GumC family protein [Tropicimonas marinistellae]|uniref:GumC family protein n=1 Tax=Tropicimonas marinistellae TaxID=1739787 RepID=UPI000AD94AC2|nr:polysaccharide biosynthesis tyrosine autokinase [Tropicimonas marinistellae]
MSDHQDKDTIDLSALFGILWRGKWLILATFLIAVVLGGIQAFFRAVPIYSATTVLMLDPQQEQIVTFDAVMASMTGDDTEVNSEVEVLKSRELVRKVVEKLDLTKDPEFNEDLQEPGFLAGLKEQVKSNLPSAINPSSGSDQMESLQDPIEKTVSAVIGAFSVRNVPNTYVLQVTTRSENAAKSVLISDTIADQYIVDQIDEKFEATEKASAWLSERSAQLREELEAAETALSEFSGSTDLVSPDSLKQMERQLKDFRDRADAVSESLQQSDARIAALRNAADRQALAEVSGDTQLMRLAAALQASPDNTGIAAQFDSLADSLVRRAEVDAARDRSQLKTLEASRDLLAEQIESQSQDMIQIQQLTREAEASRLLYEYFLGRLKETSAQQGIQFADAKILSYGVLPAGPSAPKKSVILAMSGFLGLLLGSMIVFLLEARKNTFRTARELEDRTGYVVLGQVPVFPSRSRKNTISYLVEKRNSAAAEAVRNLRTSILQSNIDTPPKIILLTSAVPSEGKTTLTLALANNFSGMGLRVLVVEGDIRRRVFGQYLGHDTDKLPGLVAVLSGQATLDEAITRRPEIGADFLLADHHDTVNAGDLFSSQKFSKLMDVLRASYDVVLIDTPPVLVVSDARVMAPSVDAVLYVVGWDSTGRDQVDEALRQLELVSCPPTGLILNQISPKGMKRYGYGGKYGSYGTYGSKYYKS